MIAWAHTVIFDNGSEDRMAVGNAVPESDSGESCNLFCDDRTGMPKEIIREKACNVAKARFLGNDPSKCAVNKLQASQIRDRCAMQGDYSSRVSNPLSPQQLSCKPQW